MRGIACWVRNFHRSPWRKLPYMQIIHLVSGRLFGCHWRWWLRNLPAIGWSQRSLRQTGESLAAFYLAPPTKDSYLPSLCRVKVVVLPAHNLVEQGGITENFKAKCLRSIFHIPPPYISRISNATVLQRNHCKRLSDILKFRQLCLFQFIAVLPDDDVRRPCIVQRSSFILQNLSAPRRLGRPKQIWVSEVYRMAVEIAEGFDMWGDLRKLCHRTRGEWMNEHV